MEIVKPSGSQRIGSFARAVFWVMLVLILLVQLFPIVVQAARELGLPVTTEMPRVVYDLMDLYPQGGGSRPSVLYVPMRRYREGRGSTSAPSTAPSGDGK